MANEVALTVAQIGACDPTKADIKSYIAASAITKGEAVAIDTAGKVVPADASTGGAHLIQFRGIALCAAAAGAPCDVLHEGEVYGYTVSALNVGAILYLSNTVGDLSTVAGDVSVICGVVSVLNDVPTFTKVARIVTTWTTVWA